ncbi:sugar ABC transporter permease [Yersinia similis]|uniref:Sugar ABC transporter permease n=1 Tax=Yersinia similis TaxID=367190 RepID=A0ABN4CRR6_9GAMM|nr:ABC transporter permease [Yersinia similis]AHK20921.1 sugar ABC transporter permease [Yersinia similis]CFQ48630.1 ABC transporter permease [Yersinia similis]CNB07215.1 ABC transporter permease [Yersinia similis]CNF01221.1 ABC transporter permease [Yersinia similis]
MVIDLPVHTKPSRSFNTLIEWCLHRPSTFTFILIIIVCLTVGVINPAFLQLSNLFDIARASVVVGLFALGVLIVLASGGLDVSFTAIAALCMYGVTKFVLLYWPDAPVIAMFIASGCGGAILGGINGVLVHSLKTSSLIVTIGTQYLYRGLLLTFIGTALYMNIPEQLEQFGKSPLYIVSNINQGITILPLFFLILVFASLLTWWLLNRTLLGRAIFAIGGNSDIAQRLGFDVRVVQIFVFAYAGLLAGIAGMVHVASNRIANPFDLNGLELTVIAAVILGGARITGGSGTVLGTLMGGGLVVLVNNVLILVGIPSTWQKVIIGAFIIAAGTAFGWRKYR